jgi:uncharacterized protein YcfJ
MYRAERPGLRLIPKGAADERVVPYEQISTIRLDLGPQPGWRFAGGFLGAIIGNGVATVFAIESSNRTVHVTQYSGLAAGGYLGYKLGGRHRKSLIIEVK